LLGTSILFFLVYWKSKSGNDFFIFRTRRNLFFLILGIVFLFGFAEEISWGQRIFQYETPEVLENLNDSQNDFSFHNLQVFDRDKWTGRGITGKLFMLNIARIFSIFWFLFCVAIPVLDKYSARAREFLGRMKFPIVPVWIGIFFILNYLALKFLERIVPGQSLGPLVEISETNYCFLFFAVSCFFFITSRKSVSLEG